MLGFAETREVLKEESIWKDIVDFLKEVEEIEVNDRDVMVDLVVLKWVSGECWALVL